MSGIGKPVFTGKAPEYRWFWLLPVSGIVKPIPIKVWAYVNKEGWTGWLDTQRAAGAGKVLPSHWPRKSWKETTEKGAAKAKAEAKAAASANVAGPAVTAPSKSVKLTGKQIREAAIAAGKAERAAASKPGLAKAEPVQPDPPTPPTGTDPGKPGAGETVSTDAASVAAALETAVQTLASVAQTLRTQAAQAAGKGRPGLAKTGAKPAPTVARRRTGRR